MKMKKNNSYLPFDFMTIRELIAFATDKYLSSVAVRIRTQNEKLEYTYKQMYTHIHSFACKLVSDGIIKSKVAIIGENSYEWLVVFLAICASGNTAVLIDAESPDEEWDRFRSSCPVRWVICDQALVERAKNVFDVNCIPICAHMMDRLNRPFVESLDAFQESVTPESDATVVFTSGTTGINKGVILSHHNICSDIKASLLLSGVDENDDILAVLPPHHAFQLVTGLLTPYYSGMCIYFGRGWKYIKKDLIECKPSILVLVPVIVRSIEKQIQNTIKREKAEKRLIAARVLSNCLLKIRIDLRKQLFSHLQSMLGGRLRCIICGGAAIEDDIVRRMISYGVPVMTGYGITECSPVVSCNQLQNYKIGTVGRATPYGEVKVINHELAVRGDIVSRGYFNLPKETASCFRNGWFFTGDLGVVDKKGFIKITGRKKNLIILSNGKNVSPEEIEEYVRSIPGVREVVVKGNNNRGQSDYLVATIWVDTFDNTNEQKLREIYQEKIEQTNRKLPSYKKIQSFVISNSSVEYTRIGKVKREEKSSVTVG